MINFSYVLCMFRILYVVTLEKSKTDQDINNRCCEILKYSQVYEPYRSIVGQERGRTHRDLNERRKIKSNLNQINPNLV